MNWLVFSYSLPAKSSNPRVALWRRIRRLGAIAIKTGVYILPARDECIEAFQWLAQEVHQAKGDALVIHVEQFEGLSDQQIIELFRTARQQEYAEIETQANDLEHSIYVNLDDTSPPALAIQQSIKDAIAKLRKRYNEVLLIDFFDCPEATLVAAQILRLEQALVLKKTTEVATRAIAEYQDRRWVTRPRPFVDRLACAWLIRRFINSNALIRYSLQPEPDEVAFDLKDAEFGHQGNLCSFEVMLLKFGLEPFATEQPGSSGLRAIAEIVHELDLRDGQSQPPEAAGVEAILRGWLLAGLSDRELETNGYALFDGLYTALNR
jgi:hypothetical protein